MSYFKKVARNILRLPAYKRRLILLILDSFLIITSILLSNWTLSINKSSQIWTYLISLIVGIVIYTCTGQYKILTQYLGIYQIYKLSIRNFLLIAITYLILSISFETYRIQYWLVFWLILTFSTIGVRVLMRDILSKIKINRNKNYTPKVVIYGAGKAGAILASSLIQEARYSIEFFVDDSMILWNRTLRDIPIYPPNILYNKKDKIDQVLFAIPSLNIRQRNEIIKNIQSKGIKVMIIPSISDFTDGKVQIDKLRPIEIEDLLERDVVELDSNLLGEGIKGSVICVTGAGGSIGSELCRQIVNLSPKKLILFEISESSLYSIHRELKENSLDKIDIKPILGSATNEMLIDNIFKQEKIEIVFHAAAYKHVPLVECNSLQGIYNNVISTKVLCEASLNNDIRSFVLISTDKAVRPTNVMGATKRLAEQIVQASDEKAQKLALKNGKKIKNFSMVRFGNVLDSSGSVVPLFREQIKNGGPITITHPEIIRYFMTIQEAASLVLHTLVLAEGGDVFLLDMGNPVRIKSLAEQMIKLSGLKLKDKNNIDGDIEIKTIGLRPGEKLYEELLINNESKKTRHKLIYRANEDYIKYEFLVPKINELEISIEEHNSNYANKILKELVPDWEKSSYT